MRVFTPWTIYPEMLITRCEPISDASTGLGMRFEMELTEILRVLGATDAVPSGAMTGNASGRSGEVSRGRVPLGSDAFLSSE